jgi:LysM repeat protein
LRVVTDTDEDPDEELGEDEPAAAWVALDVRPGRDVAARRARRAAVRTRRRRLFLGSAALAVSAALALPFSILGGSRPATPPPSAGVAVAGAGVYVVQPGDTLWSIASRFDRGGNPRPLAEALARETGSSTVVPGEHIEVP